MSGRRLRRALRDNAYRVLDRMYVPMDRARVLRTRNLGLIPTEADRRGGKHSYAEWAHVIDRKSVV